MRLTLFSLPEITEPVIRIRRDPNHAYFGPQKIGPEAKVEDWWVNRQMVDYCIVRLFETRFDPEALGGHDKLLGPFGLVLSSMLFQAAIHAHRNSYRLYPEATLLLRSDGDTCRFGLAVRVDLP